MLRFDFTLKHIIGKSMGQTDWVEEIERNNKNQMMLKKEWLKIRVMEKR